MTTSTSTGKITSTGPDSADISTFGFGTVYTLGPESGTTTKIVSTLWIDDKSIAYVSAAAIETLPPSCENFWRTGVELKSNPDVAGLGVGIRSLAVPSTLLMMRQVILSFTVSAYVVLLLTILAYLGGLLPVDLISRADRKCFFVSIQLKSLLDHSKLVQMS